MPVPRTKESAAFVALYLSGVCPYDKEECVVPLGTCHCGCGTPTNPATETKMLGQLGQPCVRGIPRMFLRGHSNRHLRPEIAREIRQRYLNHERTQRQLADEYNVSITAINFILMLDTYKEAGV